MPATNTTHEPRGIGFWLTMVLAVFIVIFGVPIFLGGLWLIALGGSWYYLFAGLGLLVTAWFLFQRSMLAVWVYLLTFAGTLVWALWEAGLDGWAQVPRLLAPAIVLVLVLLTIPVLRNHFWRGREQAVASIAGLFALGAAMGVLVLGQDSSALAQQVETPDEPAQELPAPDDEALPEGEAVDEAPADAEPEPSGPVSPTGVPVLASGTTLAAGADWPTYGGDDHATRYTPLNQITPENVGDLELVWEYRTGQMPEEGERYSNQNTPIKIGDKLLICASMNIVMAVDAATGLEIWRYDPQVSTDAIPYSAACRGVSYYASPTIPAGEPCAERILMNSIDARLFALDIEDGQLCTDFGEGGIVDLEEGIGHTVPGWYAPTSPPMIVRNIAVVFSQVRDGQKRDAPSGVVRGYDVETGEMAWAWDMGRPDEKGLPPEGETYTRGTPNVWTIASGDQELGHVYLPIGNSAVDYWGGDRSDAENEYSSAVVALDVTTGDVAWHYQTVHYDVWDYDLGSQGTLVDFPTPEGPVPALILPTKQAMFYIFDRRTGDLLVEVEERPVPQGGVEPERLSPTQPFVVDFPNALKPDIEERHMWGMTPLDQLWCRIQYRDSIYEGMYTPPSTEWWLQFPGYNGGSDWGGVAVDTDRNIMVANYNITVNRNRLVPREEVDAHGIVPIDEPGAADNSPSNISPQAGTPYGVEVNAGWRVPFTDMLCTQPPYGGIMAVDLETREVLWDKPFGTARKNGPFGIPSMLPFDIGTPNNAGAVVTASGLIFIAATTDDLFRAMDIETGEVLWETDLPAGGQASPVTYEADGRQYVVINAGGHTFMETPIGDYFLAYALPEGN
ncbi:membrane-bound PQQ-dependent dehydrogenase, glucose/quinate/shikimate family [Pelagibacterium sediminicola]|uniref:membrane-bound PQQ-dependent dehydrogenase, glucose/quinate/shikimate family n=1 Tax=Pelagibacterium sediminicola TaxID=2248761 RepID=UPI000E321172|nr:membrane-bound PQQ-dependent dehydrogenase, glucose/quinate/shikimate family [Pelagibacterium sediminicola]